MHPLVIIGAGGFGKEVAWVVANLNRVNPVFELLGFCDDRTDGPASHFGHPMLGRIEDFVRVRGAAPSFICAVGDNAAREVLVARAVACGCKASEPLIDPSVIVAPGATVGKGVYVGAGSILSLDCLVGDHVIINHHCSIAHDSVLGDFSQVCPGGRVNGGCRLGRRAFVGSGAVLRQRVSMGEGAVLGAASFALKDIPAGVTAVGNPARFLPQPSGTP